MSINVAVLGFAHGHVFAYCKEWQQKPELNIHIAAGWDHDPDRLKQTCENLQIQPVIDIDSILNAKDIHAVVIAAETSLHAELVEKAALAQKTIILQKPLALTMAEADRIVEVINRSQVPFTLAWQMRVDPQNLKMKELLSSGEFGQIFMVRRRHSLGTHLWQNFADTWHVNPKYNRDIWADDSSHAIDFIHWLLGIPETVTAEIESLYNPRIPMDNGIAIFRYPGGPIAEVVCSFTTTAAENTTEIIAEKGSIIQNYGDGPSCGVPRPENAPGLKWYLEKDKDWTYSTIVSPPNHGYRIAGLAAPLAEFLAGRRGPIATAEEGRITLKMTLACYVSTREGRRVRLDDEKIQQV